MSNPKPFASNRRPKRAVPRRGLIFEGLESRVLLNAELGIPPPPDPSLVPELAGALVADSDAVSLFAVIGPPPDTGGDLEGGADDDEVLSGPGDDTLDGTDGNDRYVFANGWGDDAVTDTGAALGDDTLDFSAVTADLVFTIRLDVNDAVEVVVTDVDGNRVTATGVEHLVGGQGDDRFVFEEGTELAGSIRGGDGIDTLDFSQLADAVTIDLARGSASAVNDGEVLSVIGIDNVIAPVDDTLNVTGTRGDNRFVSGDGDDTLAGGTGDDIYVFGPDPDPGLGFGADWGDDNVIEAGNGGADTLDFSAVENALTFAAGTVDGLPGWTVTETDLTPAANPDARLDAENVEVLIGGSGDDQFNGAANNSPTVYRFLDGWGEDAVTGGLTPLETLDFSQVDANLRFDISTDVNGVTTIVVTDEDAEDDGDPDTRNVVTATRVEHLIGGRRENMFVFVDQSVLPGTIRGTFGGNNTLDYTGWTTPVTVDLGATTAHNVSGGDAGGVRDIQNVTGGTQDDVLTGSVFANELRGNGGNDTLTGGAGDDLLIGGAGDNSYDGGAGTDTASFAGYGEAVRADLAGTARPASADPGDPRERPLLNVENLIGTEFGDTLIGDSGDNVLDPGGPGSDDLVGGGGSDTVSLRDADGPVNVNLLDGTAIVEGTTTSHTLTDIQNVIGTRFGIGEGLGDVITGNGLANRIFVAAGPDLTTVSGGISGGGDELVIYAGGRELGAATPGQVQLTDTDADPANDPVVDYGGFESVRVQNTETAVTQSDLDELAEGLRTLAERIEQLESLRAFGLGIPLADPAGASFGALLGFSRVLRQLADDFDEAFDDAFEPSPQFAPSTAGLRSFFDDWAADLAAAVKGTSAELPGTRAWLARTLAFTDSLVLDTTTGAITELRLTQRLTNARTTFMDLADSAFLANAGVFVERGTGFELTSGFNLDLTFGLQNWTSPPAPSPPPEFFVDAGERFRVTGFAALRDQLPVPLSALVSRIGFLGGTVGGAGAVLETLDAGAQAQFAGSQSRLTLADLNSTLFEGFEVLANSTGSFVGNLPFATGEGLDPTLGDEPLGFVGTNFLQQPLDLLLPDSSGFFTLATPNELLRMLGQLGEWLGALSTSEILDLTIPFAGSTTLGDALDFGQAIGEEMIRYLVQHDGLRLDASTVENGRLTDDVDDARIVAFTLALTTQDGERALTVTLAASATAQNSSAEELRAQIEQALIDSAVRSGVAGARSLAEAIEVVLEEQRIVFRPLLGQDEVSGVSLPRIGNESLGFDGRRLVVPRSLLVVDLLGRDYRNLLGHDLEFTLDVDGESVSVTVARDTANVPGPSVPNDPVNLEPLIADIRAAVVAALEADRIARGLTVTRVVDVALAAGTDNRIAFAAGAGVQTVLLTGVREPTVLIPERLSLGVETASFPTAQLLAEQLEVVLETFLPGGVSLNFDVPTRELSLTVRLEREFATGSIPLDLAVDLGDVVTIDGATNLGLEAGVALDFTFGLNLFPQQELAVAPPVFQPDLPEDGVLGDDDAVGVTADFGFSVFQQNFAEGQRLSAGPLNVGTLTIVVGDDPGQDAVWEAEADGRLDNASGQPVVDQHFFLHVGNRPNGEPDRFVAGVLLSYDTLDNTGPADLADDLERAIQNALAANLFPGIEITIDSVTEDGFSLRASSSNADFAGLTIRLVTEAEFRVATVAAVSVARDETNTSVADLVADVQAAIDDALADAGLDLVPDSLLGLSRPETLTTGLPVVGELAVPADGVLPRDVRFSVEVNGETVRGIVRAADTATNATAPEGAIAALAADVQRAINAALSGDPVTVRAHPPLGIDVVSLTTGVPQPAVSLVPADGVLDSDVVFSIAIGAGASSVHGTVRAQATANNTSRANLASDVTMAINDALRAAGVTGVTVTVRVDDQADDLLVFEVSGTQTITIDFRATTPRRLEYSSSVILDLRFESPQVVAAQTGNRISLTALPALEQPDAGNPPLVIARRMSVTIAEFDNPAYTELGLLASPVPFNGVLTSDATFRVVIDDVSYDVRVAATETSGNTTVADLLSDINTALVAATPTDNPSGTPLGTRVQVRPVSLGERVLFGANRFEFFTSAASNIQHITLPALEFSSTNAAITQLGLSSVDDSSARVQTAEFFIRDAVLSGGVRLSADDLTGSATVGFGGEGGLGVGVNFAGSGAVAGSVTLLLVNPDVAPTHADARRVTLEQIWARIGNPAQPLSALVDADITGIVDIDLAAQPVLLGRTPLEPITVSLDLNLDDWLDAPPVLDDAEDPNGIAVSVSGLDLSIYDALSNLTFSHVVGALDDVLDFLVKLQGQDGALAAILDQPLPLLNQSPSELLVIADHFATLVDDVAANPARSLQGLEDTLEDLLGLPEEFVTLSLDTEDGLALRVDLVFNASVDASFGFDLDLRDLVALTDANSPARDFLDGLTNFVGVSSTGDLDVGVGGVVRLSFGIGLGQGNGGAEALGFRDGDDGIPLPTEPAPTATVLTAAGDAQAAADRLVDQDIVFRLNVGGTVMTVTVTAGDETREPLVVTAATLLGDLDDAPQLVAGADLRVRLADGSVLMLDLGTPATVADLVAVLGDQDGLAAEFDADTRQIVLTDETESSAASQTGVYVSLTGVGEGSELSFALQVGHNRPVVPVFVAAEPDRPTWLRSIEEAIRQALVDAGEINPVSEAIVAVAYNRIAQGGLLTFQGTKDGIGERLTIQSGGVFAVEDLGDADVGTALGFIRRGADSTPDSDGEIRSRSLRTAAPAATGGLVGDVQRAINAALALARVQNPGLPDVTVGLAPPAVANTGMGRLTLSTTLDTTLEITSLPAETLVPFMYNGEDGTSIRIDAHATGENLDFTAQVGPFGFYVVDGSAELSAFFAIILVDDAAVGDDDGRTYFGEFDIETSYGGSASASLPLFFPDESTPVNDVDNVLTIGVPNLRSFLGEDAGDGEFDRETGSVTISAPDLTAFPTPTLIGMLSNPEFLIDGLDSILLSVQEALDGEIFGVELPLIGDGLAPAGQFIGDFRDDVLGYLSLKLRQGGLNPVTLVQETLYNIFASESDGDRGAVEVLGFNAGAEGIGELHGNAVLASGALARDAELNITVGRDDAVRVVVRAEDVAGDTPQALVDALNESLRGRGLDDRLAAGFVGAAGAFRLTLTAVDRSARIVVDTAGAIPLDLFGLRVGGLGLLNDVATAAGGDDDDFVDIDDILRSGFGLFDDFGQFDFLLGQHYVFSQPLDFELGLPILEFDLDAGVQLDLGWEFAFGFGVSQDDGFYFVTDSALSSGDDGEELVVTVGVGLLGVLGYTPDTAGVWDAAADRTVLTASAELPSDGRLSRDLTFALEVDAELLDVTVRAATTSANTTRAQLAAHVEAAIDAALVAAGLAPNRVTAGLHRDAGGDTTGLLELTAAGAATTLRIFDSATALGQLGFLVLDALDGGHGDGDPRDREYTSLGLRLGIDLLDPNDDDDRLSFAEISSSSTSLSDILVASARGDADVNLGLVVSFDAFGLDAALLPAIGTDLVIHWDFEFSTDTGVDIGTPLVEFRDITLDLGSFITDFAGPFLSDLADVLAPLDFLLDRNTGLLYQRLPVISDLAGETVTLLRLAELLDTENRVTPFIQAVEQVYFLANLVSDAAVEARAAMEAGDTSMLMRFGSISLPDLGGLDSLADADPDESGLSSNPTDVFNRTSSSTTPNTQNFTRTITRPSVGGGVSFDILQPGTIVDLLLGSPDVALISYDLPPFGFDFEYLQRFPIYPPLFATLRGAFSATIDLAFGYDTLGLNQFRSSGNPLDLVNGFFVNDLQNGVDIPEVTLDGTIAAGASLDAGVASAGVEGGINALIFFNMNDPNVDGRVRLGEMLGNILINSYNPLAVFDTSGRFDAFLRAYIEVLFGLWSAEYEIGRVTLASFDIPFNRAPLLASDIGNGVLELNVGTAAAHRLHGSLLDGDDSIGARYEAGSVYVSSGGYPEQRFTGISKIIVNGGAGNDVIDLSGLAGSGLEIEIHGGAGNDTLTGATGTKNRIFGDEGDDVITGGAQGDELDGGEGGDRIYGGDGNDMLRGAGGDDELFGGQGNDELAGGAGNDSLDGDVGDDVYLFDSSWGEDHVADATTTDEGSAGHDTWDFGGVGTDIAFALGADPRLASIENVEVRANGELRVTATRHGLRTGDHVEIAGIELATAGGSVLLRGAATVTVEAGALDTFIVRVPGVPAGATPVAGTGVLRLDRAALTVAELGSADDVDPAAPVQIETAVRHGLVSGDRVRIGCVDPVTGRALLESETFIVTVVDARRFNLDDTTFVGSTLMRDGAFVQVEIGGSGFVETFVKAGGIVTIASAGHGLTVDDEIAIYGLSGAAAAANGQYVVASVAADGSSFTLSTALRDGQRLTALANGVLEAGVGVWQRSSTHASSLGNTVTHNGYGIELIRGGRGGDRFDTYQTGAAQIVLDGQGGSDTYVAHAVNSRAGTGATSDVRLLDRGNYWDTDTAVFLGSQGDDTLVVDQTTVTTSLEGNGDDPQFTYGERNVVLGIDSGASAQGVLTADSTLTTGNLERAARMLVTIGADEPVLVVVEPADVGGAGASADLVAALNAAIGATPLAGRLAASAVSVGPAFRIVLTAADPSAVLVVDNVSEGSGIEAFRIEAAGGDDAIAIANTNARTSVQVTAGLGDDVIVVGGPADANATAVTLAGIRGSALTGPLVIDGQQGADQLFVTDAGNTAAVTGTLTDRELAGLGMQIAIEYRGVENLELQLGRGADELVIERTIGGTTEVAAGAGADTVIVQDVNGVLRVRGEQSADSLLLQASAAGSRTVLSGGGGDDAVQIRTMAGRVEVSGGSEDDTIDVGTGAGLPIRGDVNLINGALVISGDTGLDTLNIDDSADGGTTLVAATPIASDVAVAGRLRGDAHFGVALDGGAVVNVLVAAEPGVLAAARAVPAAVAANGRLSADAEFVLVLGGSEIELAVQRDAGNRSIGHLLDDLNAALELAGIDAARVAANYDAASGRFSFVSKQGETLEIRVRANDPAATELGFADRAQAEFDNDDLEDLEADINAALRQAGVANRVVASIAEGRLSLAKQGGTLRVTVAAGDPAALDLGLVDGQFLQPHNTGTLAVNSGRAELTGLGMGALGDGRPGITYDTIARVNIELGRGHDVFYVRGTLNDELPQWPSITTIDTGAGNDSIIVSDSAAGSLDGTLDAIGGELVIAAGGGSNVLAVSDRASNTADTGVVITASRIVGLAPAPIVYTTTGRFAELDVWAGRGSDEIRVESVLAQHVLGLFANAGNDAVTVVDAHPSADGLLLLYGGQGADRLDASAWNTALVLFGDLGEVGFASADRSPSGIVSAAALDLDVVADDELFGGTRNDLLFGALGADSLSGGLGDDVLIGDLGRVLFADGQLVQVESAELFSGSGDRLAGGAMTSAAREGNDGHDIMIGGAGFELMFGTLAEDVMIFEHGRVTLENGRVVSVITLGQQPLDLVASQMFGLYLNPSLAIADYRLTPRVASAPPVAEPSIEVSTGSRARVATHHQQVAQTIELPGVEFELGSANLTSGTLAVLGEIGMLLADFPGAVIEIGGHTDATGSAEFNEALSQQRAESVRDALVENGVDPTRLRAVGYGESRPIGDNETEQGRAQNRRVELTLSEGSENDEDSAVDLDGALIGLLSLQGLRSAEQAQAARRAPRRRIDW